jgi:hypothetical protein
MSLPQQNLPKPPPKLPPQAFGSAPPKPAVAMSAPAASQAAPRPPVALGTLQPTPITRSATPAVAPVVSTAALAPSNVRPIAAAKEDVVTMPAIDMRNLPEHMGPMVEAIQLYDALLCEENAMLKASDAKGVSALLERKMSATRLYQERLRAVLGDGESTRSLATDQRATIVAMVKCLEARARENTILLKANMGAIEQVFEVINTAARKMRRREVAYSKAGTICDSYSPHSVSLAFNQSI